MNTRIAGGKYVFGHIDMEVNVKVVTRGAEGIIKDILSINRDFWLAEFSLSNPHNHGIPFVWVIRKLSEPFDILVEGQHGQYDEVLLYNGKTAIIVDYPLNKQPMKDGFQGWRVREQLDSWSMLYPDYRLPNGLE